jgi:hypothetical protein
VLRFLFCVECGILLYPFNSIPRQDGTASSAGNPVRLQGASGSAIKGLRLTRGTGGELRVVTAGYDQRLSVWGVQMSDPGAPEAFSVRWVGGAAVNVSDVGSLDIGSSGGAERQGCCVVGEGLQMFTI